MTKQTITDIATSRADATTSTGDPDMPANKPNPIAAPAEVPNLDLESLQLNQSFADTLGVKRVRTHVPVGKPDRFEWMRVHPDPSYRGQFAIIKVKNDRETYLVPPAMTGELAAECVPAIVYTAVSSRGVVRLWDVRLPGADGKDMAWWKSQRQAAAAAETKWTRIWANMDLKANEYETSESTAKPMFPEESFLELLKIGFVDRIITSIDHPLVRRLRGLEL